MQDGAYEVLNAKIKEIYNTQQTQKRHFVEKVINLSSCKK